MNDDAATADRDALDDVAAAVEPDSAERLYQLVERGATLNPAEAKELAEILYQQHGQTEAASLEVVDTRVGPVPHKMTTEQLLAIWQKLSPAGDDNQRPASTAMLRAGDRRRDRAVAGWAPA